MRPVMPPALGRGSRVRVVSPSLPGVMFNAPRRRRAEHVLAAVGWTCDYGRHAGARWGHLAGTPRVRAEDINEAFTDPAVDAIVASLGGGNSVDVLPWLDYELIAANPKVIIGNCDNASIGLGLYARTGLVTFHGPGFLEQLGDFPAPPAETMTSLLAAISDDGVQRLRPVGPRTDAYRFLIHHGRDRERQRTVPGGWRWLAGGRASGPLIGGFVATVLELLDTPWEPPFADHILFLDFHLLDSALVDAALAVLHRKGHLSEMRGLVVAYPARLYNGPRAATLDEVLLRWAAVIGGPILVDADCGHTDPMWTLPVGGEAVLDSEDDLFACGPGVVAQRQAEAAS